MELWVFRGSLVTAAHIAPWPRRADDVDLVALPHLSREDGLAALLDLFGARPHVDLWPDSERPGLRIEVDGVQIDLAFGDPVVPGPVTLQILGVPVRAAPIEAMIAWKLHGLFELESLAWRPKDLSDLHDLLVRPALLDGTALEAAIRVAFASRDAPLRLTDRLRRRELGTSRASLKRWRRYREAHPDRMAGDDLSEVVATIAGHLEPHLAVLRAEEPDPTPFAHDPTLAEVEAAATADGFERFDHGDLRVFTYVGHPEMPDPKRAIALREHRRRQILRECRGITFHRDGRLLSRKLHRFGGFSEAAMPAGEPLAVEKLDGSMVSPLVVDGVLRLVTRRGPSELGDRATALLTDRARRVLGDLLSAGRTPLLEWTSADHRIVERHAADALWLLAVRDHRTGDYADWDATLAIAAEAGLGTPRCMGRIADPIAFAAQVRAQAAGEGWVLRWDDGTWMKLKSDRYRRLHRAVEGPDPERGIWLAALHGEEAEVRALVAARGGDAGPALDALNAGLAALAHRVRADVAGRSADPAARAALAERIADLSPAERRLRFRAWDGDDPDVLVRGVARFLAVTDFPAARALLATPSR